MIIKFDSEALAMNRELSELSYEQLLETFAYQIDYDWPLREEDPKRFKMLLKVMKPIAKTPFMRDLIEDLEAIELAKQLA